MPETGRFISEDPWPGDVTIPETLNPYPYVLNNPLKYVDPLGLRVEYEAYGGGYKNSPVANTTNSVIKKNTSNDTKYSQCPKGIADLEDIIYIGNVNSSYIPPNIGRRIASAGVGFIPVIGDIKDIQEVLTGYDIVAGEKLSWVDRGITLICAFVPIINGKAAREALRLADDVADVGKAALKNADELIEGTRKTAKQPFEIDLQLFANKGTRKTGQGFKTFNEVKKALGSPGEGNAWHHIVEQSQIKKSGFDPTQIHNTNNLIAVDNATHAKISGYYSSKQAFTGGKTVRDWLAGQSFEAQFEFGIDVLKKFGVIK